MTAAGSMAEATIAMLSYKTPSDDRWQCFLFLKANTEVGMTAQTPENVGFYY